MVEQISEFADLILPNNRGVFLETYFAASTGIFK
jgi:hypothetical protein